MSIIGQQFGHEVVAAAVDSADKVAALDPQLRLAVAELAFPAMRSRSQDEIRTLLGAIGELVNADGQVSVFEYCLGTLVYVGLHEALNFTSPWSSRRQTLASAQTSVACLLAVLAQTGNRDPRAAERAFRAGMGSIYPNQPDAAASRSGGCSRPRNGLARGRRTRRLRQGLDRGSRREHGDVRRDRDPRRNRTRPHRLRRTALPGASAFLSRLVWGFMARDRDDAGRARNSRERDELGRPLPRGVPGVPRIPDDLSLTPAETLRYAQELLDAGLAFNAHEVLEAAWKQGPTRSGISGRGSLRSRSRLRMFSAAM